LDRCLPVNQTLLKWYSFLSFRKTIFPNLQTITGETMSVINELLLEHLIQEEPFYLPQGDELTIARAAHAHGIPLLLKGPTGCGKTRFMHHLAWLLKRPLVTISCHDDLSTSDLVGRFLIKGNEAVWVDGPLTLAVRHGAICYLDEVVEARKDTTVLIHPLTDHRRILPIEKRGQVLEAAEGFLLVISYNPGYQSALKDLKHSTRQRFISVEFGHPPRDVEARIIEHESGVSAPIADDLAKLGEKVRNLKEHGLSEGVSTRLLVYTGKLIQKGIPPRRACQVGVVWALTDDADVQRSIEEVASSIFE